MWDHIAPIIDSSIVYSDNTAYLYGQNIACFPQTIQEISESEFTRTQSSVTTLTYDDVRKLATLTVNIDLHPVKDAKREFKLA